MPDNTSQQQKQQNNGSGLKVISWLLAVFLFVALVILSEYIFWNIRTQVQLSDGVTSISELYEQKGGTIEYRVENDTGDILYDNSRDFMMEPPVNVINTKANNQEVCNSLNTRELDLEYNFYDYGYRDFDTGRTIDKKITAEDLETSYYAACIDLDIMAATLNERQEIESANAFQIPLWQLFFVIPFILVGILLYLFLDRKSRTYRAIGFPYLAAVLWVGIHYLIELGIAIYKVAPQYGIYVILGAIIIVLSLGIWWLQYYIKKRQIKSTSNK